MRVFVGEEGPIAGVQAFESTTTQGVDRFGEYDSDEQVVDTQVPENNGFIEVLDSEKMDLYRALQARANDEELVDADLSNFGSPWIAVNVWNKKRTRYIAGAFVKKPTFTNQPFTTALNDATMLRFEFGAARFTKLPNKAVAIDKFTVTEGQAGAQITLSLSKTALQLSRVYNNNFVLGAVEKVSLGGTPVEYDWNELTVVSSTSNSVVLARADGTDFVADSKIMVYYPYTSVLETTTWPGATT
jgi:hypothetical protein